MHTAQVSFVTTLGTDYCGLSPRCLRYEECCVDMRETLKALLLPSPWRVFRLLLSLSPRCLRYEECCVDMRETLKALILPSPGRAFRLLLSD